MAELTTPATAPSCCSPAAQTDCCEPSEKAACCGVSATGGSCGCAAGQPPAAPDIREAVRERYAAAARAVKTGQPSCGCEEVRRTDATGAEVFGAALYTGGDTEGVTASAVEASLGCGVPTAVADLHEGEIVLDLGSGAGADVLISARRVGQSGEAIGLDMTDEMLELARAGAAQPASRTLASSRGTSRTYRLPRRASTSSSPTASSTWPPTSARSSPRPHASCARADASPGPMSSPTPAWMTRRGPTCSSGPAVSPAP